MVQIKKKIALLHRYPKNQIVETNASFPYLESKGIDVLTFKSFNRLSSSKKFWKSILWIFYAPLLVIGKGYDVIYCDDSYPFYPALVKLASPKSRVIIRLGDLHLMYYYSGWKYKFLHFFEVLTWRKVDGIIAISQAMADYVWVESGKSIYVILDPVNEVEFFSFRQVKPKANLVMFHGVLTRNKNVDMLLECAKLLPNVKFKIVGSGPDEKRLRSIAPPNVIFTGWVPFDRIYSLINQCTIGVAMRSNNPGNEYVVTSPFLQYGILGKPCLVTRRKVFGDYEWQFSDVQEMVAKIKELLVKPEEGLKLREYVIKNHEAKKIGAQLWSVLSS